MVDLSCLGRIGIFVTGAGNTSLRVSCLAVSVEGVVPYLVLYAAMRRWTSRGKKSKPRQKHLLAACPGRPQASHIIFGRLVNECRKACIVGS